MLGYFDVLPNHMNETLECPKFLSPIDYTDIHQLYPIRKM